MQSSSHMPSPSRTRSHIADPFDLEIAHVVFSDCSATLLLSFVDFFLIGSKLPVLDGRRSGNAGSLPCRIYTKRNHGYFRIISRTIPHIPGMCRPAFHITHKPLSWADIYHNTLPYLSFPEVGVSIPSNISERIPR
jgi:hypothetical protein